MPPGDVGTVGDLDTAAARELDRLVQMFGRDNVLGDRAWSHDRPAGTAAEARVDRVRLVTNQ